MKDKKQVVIQMDRVFFNDFYKVCKEEGTTISGKTRGLWLKAIKTATGRSKVKRKVRTRK